MIRLALAGCDNDAKAYARLRARLCNATFEAYAPLEPNGGTTGASTLNTPIAAPSLPDLLQTHAGAFDAVILHGRSDLNPNLVQTTLDAGKHILVNGPLADSYASALQTAARCRAASVRTMITQPLRQLPSVQAVKSKLDEGKLGAPGMFRLHRWENTGPKEAPLIDRLTPEVDLAIWLFGGTPTRIFALAPASVKPDYWQLHMGFEDNGMAVIDWCWTLPEGKDYSNWSVIGSKGAAYVDDHSNSNLLFEGGAPSAIRTEPGAGYFLAPLQQFVEAVVASPEGGIIGETGCPTAQVVEAAMESARSGRTAHRVEGNYEFA